MKLQPSPYEFSVKIQTGNVTLDGDLTAPPGAEGLVIFAHGSGSSRHSTRNRHVAGVLNQNGLATLLLDLLTRKEEHIDQATSHLRFDIALLASRLEGATQWALEQPVTRHLRVGCFGASTGGGAALLAAANMPGQIAAVVSRGGRPDLAMNALPRVTCPTLLIVGELDTAVLALNRAAYEQLAGAKELAIVPGATHLFEEPGALDLVAQLAAQWFRRMTQAASA